ncbi:hypothetical protein KIH79_09265 [Bifidobacterium sp. 82T10]|uniref:Uncharacterized protein n=1 Tax=Bifidobacterium miconis TaxID=2834435 RepID=A0ABS6WGB0_9BIFI|nr:hypothetical protein [Bifidobacterium miconis]MBW3093105.1 hypothetical protein [Bifidobacterium miconis]
MADDNVERASVSVKVVPDLNILRSFFTDMLAVIDKYDDGKHADQADQIR